MSVTSTTMPAPVQEFYDRVLLEAARDNLLHDRFAMMKGMPMNAGEQPKFRRIDLIDEQVEPLVELVVPDPANLTYTDIKGQLQQFGNYTKFSDYVTMTSQDKVITELSDLMGKNAGDSLDVMYRDKLHGSTSVYRAGNVAAMSDIDTKLTAEELRKIIRALKDNNAKPISKLEGGSDRYGSSGLSPAFFAIVDSYTEYDLKTILGTSFIPTRNYANPSVAMSEEIGAFEELRFLSTGKAKVYLASGAAAAAGFKGTGNKDVHTMLIFGKDAYGICPLGSKNASVIVKPLGSAGAQDPLDQYGTVGWKATTDLVLLNEDYMYIYQFCVSA